jgi:photosystem II stability/assembly factor-like uncharacterized protein
MATQHRALEHFLFLLVFCFVILYIPTDALAHAPHDEVRAILLSPAYLYDGIVFAIIRCNILRSTDFGYTWRRLTQGLGPYSFLDLAISPTFAVDRCLFVASDGGGIFRSNDAGLSWVAMNCGLPDRRIAFIATSPKFQTDHRLIAVGCAGQLYATNDAGDNWYSVFHDVTGVSAAAIIEHAIIVGTHTGAMYISEDNGLTWRELVRLHESHPITCFASLDPLSPLSTILAGTGNGSVALAQVGAKYQVRTIGLKGQHITSLASTRNEHGKPILFASTWREAMFRSEDMGVSWTKHGTGLTTNSQADEPAFLCPHFRGIAISSAYSFDNTLFLGGFDGVFKSTDGGKSWREMSTALSIGLIVGLDLAPLDDTNLRIIITTYAAGVYSQETSGPWEVNSVGIEGGRLFDIAFSPNYLSDQTVFAVSNWVLFRSTDGGQHWEGRPLVGSSRTSLGRKSHLYIALRPIARGLTDWLSRDLSRQLKQWLSFKLVKRIGISHPGFGAMLAISPDFRIDRTLFVGGRLGVLRSRDGGTSFQYVFGPARTRVHSLVVSPDFCNDGTVFVACEESLYRSVDGGTTWEEWHQGQEVKSAKLAISPAYGQDKTLFLGSRLGLWRSRDGGRLWQPLQVGELVGDAPVDGLAVSPSFQTDQELFVHICGIGLFHSCDGGDSFAQGAIDHISPRPAFSHMTEFPDRASLIKFSPHYDKDRTLYASSMEQLLKSSDGGESWKVLKRPVRFENWRSEISYRGKWRILRDGRFSSVSASCSSRPGDAAGIDFVGQEVRWIGMHGPKQGIAKVMIDGKCVATVDQYAETPAYLMVSFVASDLAYGPHSIFVEVSTDRNIQSSGTHIIIDAFDVI